MPPFAGAIYWARSLKFRAKYPMSKLLVYNRIVKEKPEELKGVNSCRGSGAGSGGYGLQKYSEWEQGTVETAREKFKMRLLRRMEKIGLLKMNFDPALVRLLCEIRYLLLFGLEVPPAALGMFSRADTYRTWIRQLDIIMGKYDSALSELLPVEGPLLEDRIVKMDTVLSRGFADLKWRSGDRIPDFIAQAMTVVLDVSCVVGVLKGVCVCVHAHVRVWCMFVAPETGVLMVACIMCCLGIGTSSSIPPAGRVVPWCSLVPSPLHHMLLHACQPLKCTMCCCTRGNDWA